MNGRTYMLLIFNKRSFTILLYTNIMIHLCNIPDTGHGGQINSLLRGIMALLTEYVTHLVHAVFVLPEQHASLIGML